MRDTDAAWLAGFLDGEGSFQVRRYRVQGYEGFEASVSATGVEPAPLVRCQELARGNLLGPVRPSGGNARPSWVWRVKGHALTSLLEAIIPYLTLKREHATILLVMRRGTRAGARSGEFGRRRATAEFEQRARIKMAINALNHRGSTPIPTENLTALAAVRDQLALL